MDYGYANLEDPDDCLGWDPDWYVNLNAGTYEVAESFIDSLIADPSPLIDVVMTLNGLDLDNMDDVLAAVGQLYYESETEFTLVILRGSTPVTLYCELLPPVVP